MTRTDSVASRTTSASRPRKSPPLTASVTNRRIESPSTLRARGALMPPCAATLCARRGASWKVKHSTL